jgi:hypothetical protein
MPFISLCTMGSKPTLRRAPTQLTNCQSLYDSYCHNGVAFLRESGGGREGGRERERHTHTRMRAHAHTHTHTHTMWIQHYKPEGKCQSMGRKHLTLPITMMVTTKPSGGKLTLILFWDSQGPILVHSQGRGTTVSRACYSEIFWDW